MGYIIVSCRSQWPRGLRGRSMAARLLRSWVRIPPGAWMFVCCECCVLSGRGLCDELITRPEESYRLCWVIVCDLETSRMRRPWPALGCIATVKKKSQFFFWRHWGLPRNLIQEIQSPCRKPKPRLFEYKTAVIFTDLRWTNSGISVNPSGFLGRGTARRTHDVSNNTVRTPVKCDRRHCSILRP